jgi:hypothetical protein
LQLGPQPGQCRRETIFHHLSGFLFGRLALRESGLNHLLRFSKRMLDLLLALCQSHLNRLLILDPGRGEVCLFGTRSIYHCKILYFLYWPCGI